MTNEEEVKLATAMLAHSLARSVERLTKLIELSAPLNSVDNVLVLLESKISAYRMYREQMGLPPGTRLPESNDGAGDQTSISGK